MRTILALLFLLTAATSAHAADPWGDRLRAVFPSAKVVETFDDIPPWIPSTGSGAITTNLPKHSDGSPTAINYYTNSTLNATTTEFTIKDHGDAITGQACRLSYIEEPVRQGLLGHLGFMFGNGTPQSGLRNMYVFWRVKFPKNVFPTSIDTANGMKGYYDPAAQNYATSILPKLGHFGHGITGKDQWNGYNEVTGTQQGPYAVGFPRMPYGTFSTVPELQYGGSYINVPAGPQVARMTWVMSDMGTATWPGGAGYEAPADYGRVYNWARGSVAGAYQGVETGSWIGLEFRVKLVDEAESADEMQIWYYSPEGVKTELVNRNNCYLHNIGISAGHAWNFVFLGGNTSNTWQSIDNTMVGSYLVDDVIISDGPIGDTYFAQLANYREGIPVTDTAPPVSTATAGVGYPMPITLSASEPAATYYTTDGTDPRTSPTRTTYITGSTIIINVTTTLRFYSQDVAGNAEEPQTVIYTITMPKPPQKPTIKASSRVKAR